MTEPDPAPLKIRMPMSLRRLLQESAHAHGNSLNMEVVHQLDWSLRQSGVDIVNAGERITAVLTALQALHKEALDLAHKLSHDSHKNKAISIALEMASIQEDLFALAVKLLTSSGKEASK